MTHDERVPADNEASKNSIRAKINHMEISLEPCVAINVPGVSNKSVKSLGVSRGSDGSRICSG
jgi:hypothetical protein